jgi:hypothetical protein
MMFKAIRVKRPDSVRISHRIVGGPSLTYTATVEHPIRRYKRWPGSVAAGWVRKSYELQDQVLKIPRDDFVVPWTVCESIGEPIGNFFDLGRVTVPADRIAWRKNMENEKLWQFCVYKHPTAEERKKGLKSVLVVPVSDWIMGSQAEIEMKAARAVPEVEIANAERLEVALRPFC